VGIRESIESKVSPNRIGGNRLLFACAVEGRLSQLARCELTLIAETKSLIKLFELGTMGCNRRLFPLRFQVPVDF
jgi:hypothetical protein